MDAETVQELVRDDMGLVNTLLQDSLQSDVSLISQLSSYIILNGGKRLRPKLLLLSARACGYEEGSTHILLAAIIELIHTATLLHDDVVDHSEMRRGKKTTNEVWGNAASVLVGDFIYSRAFELMVEAKSMRIMEVLAHATNNIAKGEVMQLMNCHDPDTTEERYMQVILDKTAQLFSAAGKLGSIIANRQEFETPLESYGKYLGIAFQLIDDIMDYDADSQDMGKNIGDDLAEGKPTLPLIYALSRGTASQTALLRDAICGKDVNIEDIIEIIHDTRATDYAHKQAIKQASEAKACITLLPDSNYKRALEFLADFSVQRHI
ncbi:MAG: octaprenyl diphosphate synthase [Gammaproteobacteria bacterium]|nr:MAG: octaprenyl diphosphate synthase [Gammaproteobacteria bacterium]